MTQLPVEKLWMILFMSVALLLIVEVAEISGAEDSLQETEKNIFTRFISWLTSFFSNEAEEKTTKIDEEQVVEKENKSLPLREKYVEKKKELPRHETCEDCKTYDLNWTKQDCFDENFVCPKEFKGSYLGCMPPLNYVEYAHFCNNDCVSRLMEKCGLLGMTS